MQAWAYLWEHRLTVHVAKGLFLTKVMFYCYDAWRRAEPVTTHRGGGRSRGTRVRSRLTSTFPIQIFGAHLDLTPLTEEGELEADDCGE